MTTIGTFPGNDAERGDLAVLSELRKHGSDLTQPTNVIYYLYIPAERDARSAAEALCHRGFYAMFRSRSACYPTVREAMTLV